MALGSGDPKYNPLRYTDPTGYLTQAEFEAAVRYLLSDACPNGGSYSDEDGFTFYNDSGGGMAAGVAYNNFHNSWGNTVFGGSAVSGRKYQLTYHSKVEKVFTGEYHLQSRVISSKEGITWESVFWYDEVDKGYWSLDAIGGDQTGGDNEFKPYSSSRNRVVPDGEISSFSMGFAFVGGMSGEWGIVTDKYGGRVRFKAINGNIGFGLGAGYSTKGIFVTDMDPDGRFTVDDFLNSYTHEIEAGIFIFDLSQGWQANPDVSSPAKPYFRIEGGGFNLGLDVSLWWTRCVKTTEW